MSKIGQKKSKIGSALVAVVLNNMFFLPFTPKLLVDFCVQLSEAMRPLECFTLFILFCS